MSSQSNSMIGRWAEEVVACERCPRLRAYCELVALQKRRAFQDEVYWGKPVPSFGDPDASLLIAGLAPAAHGANRTGRMFTGDRSGDFLYAALYRCGFANQPRALHARDGLALSGAYITASAHCAPPDNKPLPEELDACRPFLRRELLELPNVRVVLSLGALGHRQVVTVLREAEQAAGGKTTLRYADFPFSHGAEFKVTAPRPLYLLCSFHPSQQNTFTGKLTEAMLDRVLLRARELAGRKMAAKAQRSAK